MSIKKNNFLLKFVCRQCAEETYDGELIQHNVTFFRVECDICTCDSESAPVLAWDFTDVNVERLRNLLSD